MSQAAVVYWSGTGHTEAMAQAVAAAAQADLFTAAEFDADKAANYAAIAFGWPSMACIVIFIGGIQLLCIGILGSYLSRTYMEVKKRPIYICKESNLSPDKAVKSE